MRKITTLGFILSLFFNSVGQTYGDGVIDIDENEYQTVIIGNQEWMAENLKTSKYFDGTPILHEPRPWFFDNLSEAGWCWYDNDSSNDSLYGKLYNYKAVSDIESKNICPIGWHIPSYSEVNVLKDYLTQNGFSGIEGLALKEFYYGSNGTDEYGFSGRFGGYRYNTAWRDKGQYGHWWLSDGRLKLNKSTDVMSIYSGSSESSAGRSVRCIKNDPLPAIRTSSITQVTDSSAVCGGIIDDYGQTPIIESGVVWDTISNPTKDTNIGVTNENVSSGSFTSELTNLNYATTYYVRSYASNSLGTSYGAEDTFTTVGTKIRDIDGNYYTSVVIGEQEWMVENLKVKRYNDGSQLEWYAEDDNRFAAYGCLYKHNTITADKNICPVGWHAPSDEEWGELKEYIGNQGYSGLEGKALKSTGYWYSLGSTVGYGWDIFGFSALPGGYLINSSYGQYSLYAGFWTTTESSNMNAIAYTITWDNDHVGRSNDNKYIGHSVRCLKGNPPCDTTYLINKNISSCDIFISEGGNQLTETGIIIDSFVTDLGCDSIVTIDVEINKSVIIKDTILFKVSSTNYEEHDSFLDSIGIDSLLRVNSGCDSIIFRFEKYEYQENHFTDTITYYDTIITNVFDTIISEINDTIITNLIDTSFISVEDTLNITLTILTGTDEFDDELKVWSDGASIFFESTTQEGYKFELVSISGSTVLEVEDTYSTNMVSLSGIATGTYIAKFTSLTDSSVKTTKKIVIR